MVTDAELTADLAAHSVELNRRANQAYIMDQYYDGNHPTPYLVTLSKTQKAYERMLRLADTNWPMLIVDSVEERLEVQALRMGTEALSDRAWEIWQDNDLDADSSLAHQSALTTARAFAIVWPGTGGDGPQITIEHTSTCCVRYSTGSRCERVSALRRWRDGSDWYATLYRPEGIYKFWSKGTATEIYYDMAPISGGGQKWSRREVPGETWPLPNPFGDEIPMVELAVNRRLRPNPFGVAKGEFETNVGHIDRINYAMFSQIVAMTWSGFPLRALIGDPILYDDNNQPIKPFDVLADSLVQIENPDGKLMQLPEANLENYGLTIDRYVEELAALTKTPVHYLLGKLVNVSADAIRAAEAGLVSKIRRHHRSLGEGWEEVMRLALVADGQPVDETSDSAEVVWKDPESRSMAERADAASKLANVLPWQALCSKVLGATPQEISDWEAQRAGETLTNLIANPAPVTAPMNGGQQPMVTPPIPPMQ